MFCLPSSFLSSPFPFVFIGLSERRRGVIGLRKSYGEGRVKTQLQADDLHRRSFSANLYCLVISSQTNNIFSFSHSLSFLSLPLFQPQEQNVRLAATWTGPLGRTAGTPVQLGQHEQQQGGAGPPHHVRSFSSSRRFHRKPPSQLFRCCLKWT